MPKFIPRQRKHKVNARQKNSDQQDGRPHETNIAEVLPADQLEREEKKRQMKENIAAENKGKMSSKKKKRLDKYIDTKLKKEENLALLKKLAAQKVDTSLFQSSRRLGVGGNTKKEALGRAAKEYRAGINLDENKEILFEKRRPSVEIQSESEDDEAEEISSLPRTAPTSEPLKARSPVSPTSRPPTSPSPIPADVTQVQAGPEERQRDGSLAKVAFGSGLKRPLEIDPEGNPIITIRKRRRVPSKPIIPEIEFEWEGFSSEEDSDAKDMELGSHRSMSGDPKEFNTDDSEDSDASSVSESVDSESSEDESDASSGETRKAARQERASAFKAWATHQRNEAIGFIPTTNMAFSTTSKPINFEPRQPEEEPLPPELETNTATDATRKAFSVAVRRSPEIKEARLQLPVVAEEQKIMEAIHNNDVVVVWGSTGSGKTTQVPQFLFEAGYGALDGPTPGMIGVTQPRRVAAVSMSKRVSDELGDHGSRVAYQIRFDTTTSAKTAIKFMTDGVLLREISQDFLLTKYSAVLVDEAHERSVNTDILIGMLSRIVGLRKQMAQEDPRSKPLKLVIMSATLRISDFTENKRLFRSGPPPLVKAEGRQFEVTNHFARRTQRDYIDEAFQKICRGHRKLPRGGMMVFLTGQNEIMHLAKRLKQTFATTEGQAPNAGKVQLSPTDVALETEDIDLGAKTDDYQDYDGSDSEDSVIIGLDDEDDQEFEIGEEAAENTVMKVHVLPLYSQLPTNQQLRVFEPPPDGSRLIVLATNVAETSLTIPNIRYVFDCGRAKEKKYDVVTGVQSFEVGWISKASANQRAGRAGRTGPGHCYRLYSSAVYERDFDEYATPEIMQTPLEGVVLQLKSIGAPVATFPFPTPPDRDSLRKAENLLSYLGALSVDGKVTKLGHELSLYPLNPRFSRMLVMGTTHNMTAETIALVASLSVPELIIPENKLGLHDNPEDSTGIRSEADNLEAEERSRLRKAYNAAQARLSINAKQSDCIKLNNAICAYAYEANPQAFCDDMFLNSKGMHETSQLRSQLTAIVRSHRPTAIGPYSPKLPAPSEKTIDLLMQICAAGFIDHVAMRADLSSSPPNLARKPKTAIDVPYVTLFASQDGWSKTADPTAQFVYLHPSSLLARSPVAKLPGFIIYSHLQRAAPSTISGNKIPKTRMHPLTPISRPQLVNIALGTPLLQVSKPKGKIADLDREEGKIERRECEVELSLVGEKGNHGWGLGIRRVVQRKEVGRNGWIIDRILG
ncbi:DEAH-box RNA helicase-like protein [Polyplosphaeria fusca]|uniref:RNA helicase n=1 Tax=Polyplosphaeria fusca TaxID=682080 RepID=A0A9P4UTJ8_9PLEO|nr:DEAH-box RNA helicase-like protein [Polyplosphaeria fusca]